MLLKWIDPAIREQVNGAVGECCHDPSVKVLYQSFMDNLEYIKQQGGIDDQRFFVLEDLFNSSTRLNVELAYRSGFKEGLELGRAIEAKY